MGFFGDLYKSFLGGDEGRTAQRASQVNDLNQYQDSANAANDILSAVSSGKMSIADALGQIQSRGLGAGGLNALGSNGITGSMLARDQVMKDPTLAGLYGDKGLMSQAEDQYGLASGNLAQDRESLMGRDESYGLKDSDLAAYGQAAGNITRMMGNRSQNLSSMLAQRGLDAGASGVAGQGFSNLYGNQMEQLAGLQTQIAQNRINTARGLAQARTQADLQQQAQAGQLAHGLGQLGQTAIQNQFGRQLGGSEQAYQHLADSAAFNQNMNNETFAQQEATRAPSLGESLGKGLNRGAAYSAYQTTAGPGNFAKAWSTGAGKLFSGGGMMGGMFGGGGGEGGGMFGGGGGEGGGMDMGIFGNDSYQGGGMPSGSPSLFGRR